MPHRFEILPLDNKTETALRLEELHTNGFSEIERLYLLDVLTISASLTKEQLQTAVTNLCNSALQQIFIDEPFMTDEFSWAMEIALQPGIADSAGQAACEIIVNGLQIGDDRLQEHTFSVHSSRLILLDGFLSMGQVQNIADFISDEQIHSVRVKNRTAYRNGGGIGIHIPG